MFACGLSSITLAAPLPIIQFRTVLNFRRPSWDALSPLSGFQSVRESRVSWPHRPAFRCCTTATASPLSPSDQRTSDKILNFRQWLTENGAVSPANAAIKLCEGKDGLGLVAIRNISSGEEVVNVPDSLIMSLQSIDASSPLAEWAPKLKPWVALALFVVLERANPVSRWKPYLDVLPTTLHSPIFWSEQELAELKGTQLLTSVESYRLYLESAHRTLLEVVGDGVDPLLLTRQTFDWAFGILRSRSFPPLTGDDIALLPLADMVAATDPPSALRPPPSFLTHLGGVQVNHGQVAEEGGKALWERRAGGVFGGQRGMGMRAGRRYLAGEAVVMNYGADKSNADLALDYGFAERQVAPGEATVLNRRSRETFVLTLEIAEDDRFLADKADVAESNGLSPSECFAVVSGEGPPEAMLTYLRLCALGGADSFLLEALFRDAVWGQLQMPVSRDNEEAVCEAMVAGCRAALEGYGSSTEQDLRLLREEGLPVRLETAVVVRVGEKRVLTELLDFFETRAEGLDNLEYYAERRLRDLGLLDENSNMTPWVFND